LFSVLLSVFRSTLFKLIKEKKKKNEFNWNRRV
jgi:hypothetical protein